MAVKKMMPAFLVLLVFMFFGCAGKSNYEFFVREDVDFSFVENIAVLPVENNSADKYIAERVRNLTITQILANNYFDVVDKGLVDSILKDEAINIDKAPMELSSMQRVGQRMNVQAFLACTVDLYDQSRRGPTSYPVISLTLRLIDADTGIIFWQASGNNDGDSIAKSLLGLRPDDSFKVTLDLIKQLLTTLPTLTEEKPLDKKLEEKEFQEEGLDPAPDDQPERG